MASKGISAPELSVVFLIPVRIDEISGESKKFLKFIQECKQHAASIEQYCVPVDVKDATSLTDDLRIFYESDMEYFDDYYLKMRRFCRIDLSDYVLTLTKNGSSRKVLAKPYLTVFDAGIAVYTLWLVGFKNLAKKDIIDLCFINKIQVQTEEKRVESLLSVIQQKITSILGSGVEVDEPHILENHLAMLFIKDLAFKGEKLPEDFIAQYKHELFDIVSLPERYHGRSYDYHQSRTPEYIDHVLRNISVRNDFPVFLFDNRFLGIKILTDKPDYDFSKRVIFNIVLYTNVVLQLMLIKGINNQLSGTVNQLQKVTLGHLVRLRRGIYRSLEEYINTSIQRYEIWKMAMEDAAKQLGIPELYSAVKERLEMLNMYLGSTFQQHSNILFVIMNTIFFFGTAFNLLDFFLLRQIGPLELAGILVIAFLWASAIIVYYSRYVR